MNRKILLILILFSFILSSCTQVANYNIFTKKIVCYTKEICVHEIAHKYDDEHKISSSQKYRDFIATYRAILYLCPECRDQYSDIIVFFPGIGSESLIEGDITAIDFWTGGWGGYDEMYAEMAEYYYGNDFPYGAEDFYDLEYISNELKMLGY